MERVPFTLMLFMGTFFAGGWRSVLPRLPAEQSPMDKGLAGHSVPEDASVS